MERLDIDGKLRIEQWEASLSVEMCEDGGEIQHITLTLEEVTDLATWLNAWLQEVLEKDEF